MPRLDDRTEGEAAMSKQGRVLLDQGENAMKNPTAENVLKKTFAYLDEIIAENKRDSAEAEDQPCKTVKERKSKRATTLETAEEES